MQLGVRLGSVLVPRLVIGMVGQLGAGKTHFTKGVAAGNGLQDIGKVTSPTFTLCHQYRGDVSLNHLDVYRLTDPEELRLLGFEDLVNESAATIVEWADRVTDLMPEDCLWIQIEMDSADSRRIMVQATGDASQRVLAAWRIAVELQA